MNKLLTTTALILGLLFGGVALVTTPAAAADPDCGIAGTADCLPPSCDGALAPGDCVVAGPCSIAGTADCLPGNEPAVAFDPALVSELLTRVSVAEQTANDYRAQVVALNAKAERLQHRVDRQAATIARLRAKIRDLR